MSREKNSFNRLWRFLETTHVSGGRYHALLDVCHARLLLVIFVLFLGFGVISVRVLFFAFAETDTRVTSTHVVKRQERLMRANITERNGHVLASSILTKSLNADVPLMRKAQVDLEEAAEKIAFLFSGIDPKKLIKKFQTIDHFPIRTRLTPEQAWQVRKLGIPGIFTLQRETRVYPYGNLFAHIVGFVDQDNQGQNGVELSFNSLLQRNEEELALSLDIPLQHILHGELTQGFKEQQAKSACGIIMDVRNFEILAMVSLPDYDPHHPSLISKGKYFNCATQGSYELGSTFKIITTAMALEVGVAQLESIYDTTHPIRVSGQIISDTHLSSNPLNLRQIFVRSSNVGAALIAKDIGSHRQRLMLSQFGLLDPADIELEGRSHPIIASDAPDISTLTIGFGHGIAVSPLNLVSAVGALVNDGVGRSPTLLYLPELQSNVRRVVSSSTSNQLRQLMYLAVREGTGRSARIPGYAIGGKTGTAEKPVLTEKGWAYSGEDVVSSFIAALPINRPEYVIYVLLDEPKGLNGDKEHTGASRVAAPIVRKIVERLIPLRGMAPVDEKDVNFLRSLGIYQQASKEERNFY